MNQGAPSYWGSAKQSANQGWEVVGFDNENCTGDAVVKLTNSDLDTCVEFERNVYGFSVTPLWNAN